VAFFVYGGHMARVKDPTQPYAGRNMSARVLNITLQEEEVALLRQFCQPGMKTTGRFIGRLLLEHNARLEERKRLQEALQVACGEGETFTDS